MRWLAYDFFTANIYNVWRIYKIILKNVEKNKICL